MKRRKWRVRGRSLEERVWYWLRRQEGAVKLADVCSAFDLNRRAASSCCRRLVAKGSAVRHGNTVNVTYQPTDICPDDMRGTAINTLRVLQRYSKAKTKRRTYGLPALR